MMADLIDRQAAIDAVDNYIGTFDAIDVNFLDGLKTAKKLMMQLPSAQPDVTDTNVGNNDLISRQAAVELCLEYNGVGWVWSQILDELKEMPSAVVQCKDCKHSYETFAGLICSHGVCVDCVVRDDFYCSYGERNNDGFN